MNKKTEIVLTPEQRKELIKFTETGVHSARQIKRARVILLLDTSGGEKSATFAEINAKLNFSFNSRGLNPPPLGGIRFQP